MASAGWAWSSLLAKAPRNLVECERVPQRDQFLNIYERGDGMSRLNPPGAAVAGSTLRRVLGSDRRAREPASTWFDFDTGDPEK